MRARPLVPLALALTLSACSPKDAAEGSEDSKGEKKPDEETSDEGEEVDISEKLGLEQRDFPLVVWAAYMIEEDYFDRSRIAPKAQMLSALEFLGLQTPEFFAEQKGDKVEITVRSEKREFTVGGFKDLMAAGDELEKILMFAQEVLALEDEPLHELEYAAINGMLAPLDPHTILLTPEEHADLGVKTRGRFAGVGAEIRPENRRIVVARVLPGSPAEKDGLKGGDIILQIDDQSTVNMTAQDASEVIRGPVGTKVTLKVRRGDETLTIEITRDTITIETVQYARLNDDIGYAKILSFQEDTAQKLQEALESKDAENIRGLVIDLRGNSGGLLTQATGILDQMVTEGELVIVHSVEGREHQDAEPKLVLPENVSVVALVDEGSASASEIVAGSVKHLSRGVVVGRTSFGKGTVQMLRAATPYGRELALKLTIAEYRVAGDRKINSVGVRTDLELMPVMLSEIEGVAGYYDRERFERARQRYRTAHLPSAHHDEGADAFVIDKAQTVYYLGELADVVEGQPEQLTDPEIRLASEVAAELADAPNRKEAIAKLNGLAPTLAAREDKTITDRLGEKKIDWTAADTPSQALDIDVALSIKEPFPLEAGEPFTMSIRLENKGSEAAKRVHLTTSCELDELDGIEYLVGTLEPGEVRTDDLLLQVMAWHPDLTDDLEVEVHAGEPEEAADGEAALTFDVAQKVRPRFAVNYWIVDDPSLAKAAPKRPEVEPFPGEVPFEVKGNGDGLLQPGEQVIFAFEMQNLGDGKSPDAQAVLRNLSGSQGLLEEGSVELGELGTGKTATGAFGISISPKADAAIPLELELLAGDAVVRQSVRQKMRLKVLPDRAGFAAAPARYKVLAEPATLHQGADNSAAKVGTLAAGSEFDVIGTAGKWLVIKGDRGRRYFVPADLAEKVKDLKKAPKKAGFKPDALLIDPPLLSFDGVALRASGETIAVTGTASHFGRVRDVMVTVEGENPSSRRKKVYYQANPEASGDGAKALTFKADVPLESGSNRITVVARDQDKIERTQDLRVYRE